MSAQSIRAILSDPSGLERLASVLDAVDVRARLFGGTLQVEGEGLNVQFGAQGIGLRPSAVMRRVVRRRRAGSRGRARRKSAGNPVR